MVRGRLGHRSVLARPDRPDLRDRLNLVLKRRVWYQPFCPSMLESEASRLLADWTGGPNRSMTMAYKVVEQYRAQLAGAMSVDGTCRPQIVADDDAGPFAALLREARRSWDVGGGAQYQLQHPRRAARLLARRGRGRVPSIGRGRAGHRSVPRRTSRMTDALVPPASSRRAWIAVGGATLGTLAVPLVWLLGTSTGDLREQLKVLQPWWLDACVLAGLIVAVYLFSTLASGVFKREGVRLATLAALGAALTLAVAPRTNRIFYDEQIYQSIGQNLADLRLAQVCHDGSVEYGRLQCASGDYNKQPYGYPHALSLAYRLLGAHAWTAFAVNATVMALTACAVYLLVYVLFGDREAALFAGLLIALTPQQLMWSATAAVEPSASFVLVLALLCAGYYLRTGTIGALCGTAVATAYAIQFRPESLVILPVIGLIAWPRLRVDLGRPGGWWAVNLFLWLSAIHLAHLFAVRHIEWGTVGPRFSLRYLPENLRVNGWFYLYDERFPVVFSVLAVAGLLSVTHRRARVAMAMCFLLFFAVGLVFYAGSYNYGADVRYSLMTYPPIAVLGGLGASRLARVLSAVGARWGAGTIGGAVTAIVLLFQFLWYAPVVRATTEEAWAARADVRFAQTIVDEIPRNSYVLTHNPGMFHLWGVNAGQMSLVASNPAYVGFLAQRYRGGVYLHWNFWCNVQDRAQQELCRNALAMAPGELIGEYHERDQRFAFYRLNLEN